MRVISRLTMAAGVACLLTFATVPTVQARGSDDDTNATSTHTESGSSSSKSGSGSGSTNPVSSTSTEDKTTSGSSGSYSDARQKMQQQLKDAAEKRTAEAKAKTEELKAKAEEAKAKREQASQKLNDAKLKLCEKRQMVIGNVMTRMNGRGQKQLDLITAVSTKVQAYKTSENLAVANYDTLLAAATSSKAAAQASVDAVKNTQVDFKCDGIDPKGVASSFKDAIRVQNDALKVYRDAVKDLVKAVRQASSATATTPQATPPTNGDDDTTDQGQGDN